MKLPSNKEEVYSLKDRDNYRSAFHEDMTEVVVKIAKVFVEYYKRITESTMPAFSMIRGLDTILHVYRYVFLYTKNSDGLFSLPNGVLLLHRIRGPNHRTRN